MSKTIRTTRQDIYVRLVKNAKRDRGRESDEGDQTEEEYESEDEKADEHLFEYQYELFSFAVARGFLNGELIEEPDNWSQDILKLSTLSDDNPHVKSIEFIEKLVEYESINDDDPWDLMLRYADAGVEDLAQELDTQEDFDLVRFVRESDADEWQPRLIEALGDPDEVGAGL